MSETPWRICIAELREIFLFENTGDINSILFKNTVEFMKKEPEFMLPVIKLVLDEHQRAAKIIANRG